MNNSLNKKYNFMLSFCALFLSLLFASITIAGGMTETQVKQKQVERQQAEQGQDKQALQALIMRLESLQTFQSAYKQTVIDKNSRVVEESQGSFYLGLNKSFKNTVTSPEHSEMISNGEKLWMIDHELEQVSVNYLKDFLEGSPIALLLEGSEKSLQDFTVSILPSENKAQKSYKLIAIDSLASISEVRLSFNDNKITSIEIDEKSGNKVKLKFLKITSLKNPKKTFLVDIPKGFDLVDETEPDETFSNKGSADES